MKNRNNAKGKPNTLKLSSFLYSKGISLLVKTLNRYSNVGSHLSKGIFFPSTKIKPFSKSEYVVGNELRITVLIAVLGTFFRNTPLAVIIPFLAIKTIIAAALMTILAPTISMRKKST